jgi:hypothetical protein
MSAVCLLIPSTPDNAIGGVALPSHCKPALIKGLTAPGSNARGWEILRAPFRTVGLAPVAVLPEQQGRHIGSRLIRASSPIWLWLPEIDTVATARKYNTINLAVSSLSLNLP